MSCEDKSSRGGGEKSRGNSKVSKGGLNRSADEFHVQAYLPLVMWTGEFSCVVAEVARCSMEIVSGIHHSERPSLLPSCL